MRKTVFVIIFILFTLTVSSCFKTNEATIRPTDVGRILRTFKIKKNVEVTDNGKIII